MKKILLLVAAMTFCVLAKAQEYKVDAQVRIKSDLNEVSCESYFKLTFTTEQGHNFVWTKKINLDEGSWGTYDYSVYCSMGDRITHVSVWTKRETGDCETHDGGTREFDFPLSNYPCSNSGYTGQFDGYSNQSALDITVTPLTSPNQNTKTYVFETQSYVVPTFDDREMSFYVEANFTDGTSMTILQTTTRKMYYTQVEYNRGVVTLTTNKTVRSFTLNTFYFIRSYTKTFTPSGGNAQELHETFTSSNKNPFEDLPLRDDSEIQINYFQVATPLSNSLDVLPSENVLTLASMESYSYSWWYQIEGEGWNPMPVSWRFGKSISLNGNDLFNALSKNISDYFFKTIYIKGIYDCSYAYGYETETIPFKILPSVPRILNIGSTLETCYRSGDAKFNVTFSRPLHTFTRNGVTYSETLVVKLAGQADEETVITSLDAGRVGIITGRKPGTYDFTVSNTFGALGTGYSNGAKVTGAVGTRTAINNFTLSGSDVHCYAGEDGRVLVNAKGGTGNYTATTFVKGVETSIPLSATTGNSFVGLPQGGYTVTLKDTNGCPPKDNFGNNTPAPSITLNQPVAGVLVGVVENIEPLGYGLTNGHVTVRTEAGTPQYTFRWTNQDSQVFAGDAPVQEGASVLETLSNIGKGTYQVRAQDANYALVSPANKKNLRGCYDSLILEVTEPPLLEVYSEEFHFVSCNGYSDGEVVAHAKGGRPYLEGNVFEPYRYDWFSVDNGTTLTAVTGDLDSVLNDRPSDFYRVRVTDRNGITAWSDDFNLVQPDVLAIGFNTPSILCNGDTNGTSEALVSGGTPGYTYAWSTDESTPSVQGLSDGWYSVIVKDIRGCTTFAQTEVKVPNGLEAAATLVPPLCNSYSDGSVSLAMSGGVAPYIYAWDNGTTAAGITDLPGGAYTVRVTDANGCFIDRTYTLVDPALFAVELGPDRVLCKDQELSLNVALPGDNNANYVWLKDGASFATTSAATLSETGKYRVEVRDSKGCFNSDEVSISRDETVIDASIVVASRVPVGGRVRIANISNPASDRVSWIIPSQATLVEEDPGYLDLMFPAKGEYSVGLTGYKNACEATTYTTVRVVGANELPDYQAPNEPYIKQFAVTPNPNSGQFTASVELREAGDFSLVLFTGQGTVVMRKDISQQNILNMDFDVSGQVGQGIYVLQLQTREGYATFKVSVVK